MAAEDLAAKRYAQAAFELAEPAGNLRDWQSALERIAAFMSERDVAAMLENTRVPEDAKLRLVAAGLADLPALPYNLARLLVHKRRTALARAIHEAFRQLVEERLGIVRVRAVTAVPLSDSERQALIERLQSQTGREIILDTDVDPQLLGGVRFLLGDTLVDASTKARLEALRESLVGAV
jgi:F-type H+-transporting ATPase subunit delta